MARAAFALRILPDKIDDYLAAHEHVWPEMLDAIRSAGIRNYTIFLHDGQAFGYFEADDIDQALDNLEAQNVNTRWQDAMEDLLETRVDNSGPPVLREIFRLE